ncbi:MAG TPA: 16S rRNA (uracil(1498)-N(3))-methyltransferase [Aquabacterium sp.]|uniref:16S rRNA (uracil(1498)-N(3))-methyltransferase n=1 Tax=Aquabacterium sp. TaxID=1872578 RepID=UPI002E2ED08F|nr:16S rRNA (uracil(1498)-N(3))-methyltransferase [Aquabacterium sp.]HEX5357176.1 16S rRNA (uracil(1498)-N(3))-methyltransferase [Aquabacterium sp.]
MLPRFHVGEDFPLQPGSVCELPDGPARHVQVLRMQPGGLIQLFDGQGREHRARVTEMGRKQVTVEIEEKVPNHRELPVRVTLAMGMPANDRMDALVEKATELGVSAIQPLVCERSVLRLDGERAAKKVAHWQAVAVSACEQSGRAVVPQVHAVQTLQSWLRDAAEGTDGTARHKGVLSLRDAVSLRRWLHDKVDPTAEPRAKGQLNQSVGGDDLGFMFLSGPEGGLSPAEEQAALDAGWTAITLGARVLRADTAPLAALSVIGATFE